MPKKKKKSLINNLETTLEEEIAKLEKVIECEMISSDEKIKATESLHNKKLEFERIYQYKTKGSIIRCKAKWYNEGEKNTNFFLNLEKRHYKQTTIGNLKLANSDTLTKDHEVLNECKRFYENLYSSTTPEPEQTQTDFFFPEANQSKLSLDEVDSCEGLLTENECLEALKTMDRNKSPGNDSLPAKFHKAFWEDISKLLVNTLNCSYEHGTLSISQRRGLIKLILKKNSILSNLKNWRPLSLLNTDYIIASKAIANRLKKVLPNLIGQDQTGFLKNRSISENILLIEGMLSHTEREKIAGLLLFVDFEKAFNTIEWAFIVKTLKHYNFRPSLVKWFKTFYNDPQSNVMNNGWASEFFSLSRGVRQGCPMLPYLFILSAEILASAIRNKEQIKGITVDGIESKLSQYANDTTLILDGNKSSMVASFDTLDAFHKISGLKANNEKTEVLWISASSGNQQEFLPERNLKWAKHSVKALGFWFSTLITKALSLNYNDKIEKIQSITENWASGA